MAANEGMKDLLVLEINESPSLSLATSHSTRNVGFNISSCVTVSMVTLQLCMHSTPLQKVKRSTMFLLLWLWKGYLVCISPCNKYFSTNAGQLAANNIYTKPDQRSVKASIYFWQWQTAGAQAEAQEHDKTAAVNPHSTSSHQQIFIQGSAGSWLLC